MSVVYVDSSVLLARRLGDQATAAGVAVLARALHPGDRVLSSQLAEVEVHRVLRRLDRVDRAGNPRADDLDVILGGVALVSVDEQILRVARDLTVSNLATLDSVHVATALLCEASIVLTTDRQMSAACHEVGLAVA